MFDRFFFKVLSVDVIWICVVVGLLVGVFEGFEVGVGVRKWD